jgi:hypothetical protein
MRFIVRTHYHILPTNPDWLAMTEEQILKEFYLITARNKPAQDQDEEDEDGKDGSDIMEKLNKTDFVDEDFDQWFADQTESVTGTEDKEAENAHG